MKFNYKAINDQGKTIGGVVETDSKQAVLALLKKQGYRPILVNQEKRKLNATIWSSKKVKLQDLVVFSRQLSTMVSAGVPLVRSLAALQGDTESPYLKEVLVGVTKDVESGLSLAEAFSKYPTVFDEIFVSMVRAGEEGGILDDILKRLAHQIELNASLRKKNLLCNDVSNSYFNCNHYCFFWNNALYYA
jgi:Type II secretory pathway, component PulF